MSSVEYITPEGFRLDGRQCRQLRKCIARVGCADACSGNLILGMTISGSAYFQLGNTKVLVYINVSDCRGMRRVVPNQESSQLIQCIIEMNSVDKRMKKGARIDRHLEEIQQIVQKVLNDVIILPEKDRATSKIFVLIDVLEDDGGLISVILNACSLAAVDAGIRVVDLITACTIIRIENYTLTDPTTKEIQAGNAVLHLAINPRTHSIAYMESSSKMQLNLFRELREQCMQGCDYIHTIMKQLFIQHAQGIQSKRLIEENQD